MRLTLRDVFIQHQRVVVPLLQRDYAHGRSTAETIRQSFFRALHKVLLLPEDDASLPLDLDFVYGGTSASGQNEPTGYAFAPLDGQQRLTTIYLLHWYLAVHDGDTEEFRSWARVAESSAFSYHVRPSATDFFDTLVNQGCALDFSGLPTESSSLSQLIKDQPWFYQSWEVDPTIASCLVVLDSIHDLFSESTGLYLRLTSQTMPAITFQFLHLEHFGLSDDLYIKMNARGKPLTPFETFKASLERAVPLLRPGAAGALRGQDVPLRVSISQKFDTEWCDLFWSFRNELNQHSKRVPHDDVFMNAIRAVALVSLIRHTTNAGTRPSEKTVNQLREGKLQTFHDFDAAGCITPTFIDDLVTLFDRWADAGREVAAHQIATQDYDAAASFKRIVLGDTGRRGDALPYAEWLQFVGWALYWLEPPTLDGFGAWMRLVSNLVRNTTYNRAPEFIGSAQALVKMVDWAGPDLLSNVVKLEIPSFYRQQVREEKLKASLMLRDERWAPLIVKAEAHAYFIGQIEFLFAFAGVLARWLDSGETCAWDALEDSELRGAFSLALQKASAMFVEGVSPGLRSTREFLFERALLCEGDYLLNNQTNHGFLDDTDRDLSWKRLLRSELKNTSLEAKRDIVKRLFNFLDPSDVEGSLKRHINAGVDVTLGPAQPWREALIRHPALIGYCKKRQLRFARDGEIYLLQGERRNGRHKEVHTAALVESVKPLMAQGLGRFRHVDYRESMNESDVPCAIFKPSSDGGPACTVTYQRGGFHIEWDSSGGPGPAPNAGFGTEAEVIAALRAL